MAWLNLYAPAEDVTALRVMLDAAADTARAVDPADPRTVDQLRADVLSQLAWASLQSGHLGGLCDGGDRHSRRLGNRHGRAAAINVTVPLSTLIGIDDRPGELEGYGPITADVSRHIAAAGIWRRLLTDPSSGALLDYGQSPLQPTAGPGRPCHRRDRTCRFPTCSQPARRCQIDRTISFQLGGPTSADNNGPLSGGCHNGKTNAGWRLEQPEPGRYLWTAPTGHRYPVDPEIVGPIITRPEPPGHPPEHGPPPDLDLPPY
jgi:hypothetical protein